MFGKRITLFKMFGFAVRIDLSWLIILGLVIWSLAAGVFPNTEGAKGLATGWYVLMGVAGATGLFGGIVLHELCHSLVARRYGLPMKGITLFIFGGVAEMSDEPPSAKAEFLMAIAGPLSSVVIGGTFVGVSYVAAWLEVTTPVVVVLRWVGFINAMLAGFNLLPGFPLDGGRVLRSILWSVKGDLRWATRAASAVGSGLGLAMIIVGIVTVMAGLFMGLWWILIGWFLRAAATQGYQHVLIRGALAGEQVRRFMNPEPVTVSPELKLSELVEDYIYRHHFKMFPVVEEGRLEGCISTRQVAGIPKAQWAQHTVGEVDVACGTQNTIGPDEDAMVALSKMQQQRVSRLLVVEEGKLVGILALRDLLKFLSLKLELESGG